MTTDQLERDLSALAEPHAEDEQLRLAVRATLREQLEPRRRRRPRFVLGAAAAAAATLAAAIVALIGSGGNSPADAAILAHAARTMNPPANMIVHVKESGAEGGQQVAAEWWQATDAPYAMRLIKGRVGQEVETASDGTTSATYDAGTDTVYEQPESKAPKLIDPAESARAALANGTAHVDGTATIAGRSLYKIDLGNGVVGYFDRTSYRPVYIDNPQSDGSVVRTRVLAYEELPLTSETEQLLNIAEQHPGARVQKGTPPGPSATGRK